MTGKEIFIFVVLCLFLMNSLLEFKEGLDDDANLSLLPSTFLVVLGITALIVQTLNL